MSNRPIQNKQIMHIDSLGNIKSAFFAIIYKTNAAVKWIMNFQPKWGSSKVTLPEHIFMPSLKKDFLIYQQLLTKQVLTNGKCYINITNYLD